MENKLIIKCAELLKNGSILESQFKQLKEKESYSRQRESFCEAMLADICETIFGNNANGSPRLLCQCHGRWVCGVSSKKKDECFLEYRNRLINTKAKGNEKEIQEWKEFLITIKSDFKRKD